MDEYRALIGAPPSTEEQQRAIAEQLRRRRSFGELGALTGDRVLQPFGANMVGQADSYAKQLQQSRQQAEQEARMQSQHQSALAETMRANRAREAEAKRANDLRALTQAGRVRMTEADKAALGASKKRFEALNENTSARRTNIKKAMDFLEAFSPQGVVDPKNSLSLPKGFRASSGAGRAALGVLPGVYTTQGQFDEQLDAFAETAARARLKALGEIRPTDADVKGMKAALFGKGRDETVNANLLRQYLEEQMAEEEEYEKLRGSFSMGGGVGSSQSIDQNVLLEQILGLIGEDDE